MGTAGLKKPDGSVHKIKIKLSISTAMFYFYNRIWIMFFRSLIHNLRGYGIKEF